ncbi:MAG TPA: hypothetical protein VHR86_09390, partial [Armatimonadota bacterium]|nr:hypothetical protein [Armatimonadota bacterium]
FRILAGALFLAVAAGNVNAATAKKAPVKKTAAKKAPASSTNKATTGTQQLKGGWGEFGSTYTTPNKECPWNVTLKSAEYSVETLNIGDMTFVPKGNEKILVLHLTMHNPQPRESVLRFDTIHFTAVDTEANNYEDINNIGAEKDRSSVDQGSKPAQKTEIYTALVVPAKAQLTKLMLQQDDNGPVIRYDLRGKIKPLPAVYADPADKSGLTALEIVPAQFGTSYFTGPFTVTVEGTSLSDKQQLGEMELGEGKQFFIVNLSAKNVSVSKQMLRFDTFTLKPMDADGAASEGSVDLLRASSDKPLSVEVEPGQELKCRFYMVVEKDLKLKSMDLGFSEEGRWLRYELK